MSDNGEQKNGRTEAWDALKAFLVDLRRLNPDYTLSEVFAARAQAEVVGSEHAAEAAELVGEVIRLYLASPQKQAGGEILHEYYSLLESEEKRLLESGVMAQEAPEEQPATEGGTMPPPTETVVALVPRREVPPLTRCVVLNHSQIPTLLSKAADAYRRRNMVVDTVVELGLDLLWRLDAVYAENWMLGWLEEHTGQQDPDVIRDLLRVVFRCPQLSRRLFDWILKWCGDARLLDSWPNVIYTGDRVLCRHAVQSWLKHHQPRNSSVAHLKLLFANGRWDDESLLHWLESALGMLADCVLRIMALDKQSEAAEKAAFSGALFSELKRLANVYPLVMMVGNQLLCLPDGAHQFALAVFGLAGEGLRKWNEQLEQFCAGVIRRVFILDMRAGRTPVETIRRLTFSDEAAFRMATSQLDLVSERFDSLKQREKVIGLLVPFYASYRQDKFLSAEVTRRFRQIMRMLHEDYLGEWLDDVQLAAVREWGSVADMAAMVGDARKYLSRRRDQISSLERILAARMTFEEATRKRRLDIIRRELMSDTPVNDK